LRNKSLIDLSLLDLRLIEAGPIEHVDIYGGEPGTLPSHFAIELIDLLKRHTDSINVISNFSVIPDWFRRSDITVSASYDWIFREHHDKVLTNIISFSKPIPILMLATDKLCKIQPKEIAKVLNNIRTIGSLEIKPYSQNQFNQYEMDWTVFEEWIKEWIALDLNFHLVNKDILDNSKNKLYNAYSDNHLYIGPDSNFSVLDFDLNDREYFRPIKDIADYKKWTTNEIQMVQSNKFCRDCRWQGHCATEHYRNVTTLEYSCNGFKNLLDWYDTLEN
jgi:hypothetical protein